jgi:ergothioneine biosynthesis protein EgtB
MRKMQRRNAQPPKTAADHAVPLTPPSLAARYAAVRRATGQLVEPLSPEDCALQSMPDASPAKWHLAHTSWFFETFVLERFVPDYRPFHPAYRALFNSYYNAVGDKYPRPERGLISRPGLPDVLSYRKHVDAHVADLLEKSSPGSLEISSLVELGVNHEEQHQELILTDVKHLLWRNPQRPAYVERWPLTPIRGRKSRWIGFDGGLAEIGRQGDAFAFDNEGPRHSVVLRPFEIASHPVTHGDFLAFVEDRGYQRPELWLSLGWDAVQAQGWRAPLYWERDEDGSRHGDGWRTFTLHGMAKIDPHTPICHVSYYEADAYARWAHARLPTEAEWEVVASEAPVEGNFLENRALHPLALRDEPPAPGLAQLFGDVWEWTQSAYSPYPGFQPAEGAVGEYNGKFMCNQYVLRGGSCATPVAHIRDTYRNFFPTEARWQFSGLRLARDA